MGGKKRNHTVPITYLKRFSFRKGNADFAWMFDKKSGTIRDVSVVDACVEKNAYTLDLIQNKRAWEDFYGEKTEPKLGSLLTQILKRTNNPLAQNKSCVLDDETKVGLAFQMILQIRRGRRALEFIHRITKEVYPDAYEQTLQEFRRTNEEFDPQIDEIKKCGIEKLSMAEACVNSESITKCALSLVMGKCWVLYRIIGNAEFVTSDNPVMVMNENTKDVSPFCNGIGEMSSIVLYPISYNTMISIHDGRLDVGVFQEYDGRFVYLDANKERA